MKKAVLCQMALLALACASCRNNNHYPVSGKVTYNGSPTSGAYCLLPCPGGDAMNDHTIMGMCTRTAPLNSSPACRAKAFRPAQYDVLIEWRRIERPEQGACRTGPRRAGRPLCRPKTPSPSRHGGGQSHELAAV